MKTPKILTKLSAVLTARSKRKLQATARAVPRASMDSYEADEPTTKLSSAFVVVLILHCVAVGGIYAFNSIKASRRGHEQPPAVTAKAKPAATADAKAPAQSGATASVAASQPVEGATAPAPVPVMTIPKASTLKQYTVKTGDNATKIALAYGLKTDELLVANNLKDGAILRQGQVLTIPTPKPAARPATAEAHKVDVPTKQTDVQPTRTTPGLHIVKKGDTATSIAKSYGLTADELLKLNKITDAKKLQPGQTLTIPKKKG